MDTVALIAIIAIPYAAIFGGLAAWLANAKNRSVGSWFFLGVLLGPLAILAVGLAPVAEESGAVTSTYLHTSLYPSEVEHEQFRQALQLADDSDPDAHDPRVLDERAAQALKAISDGRSASLESGGHQAPTGKLCPDCAEVVQAQARICRFCRHEFDSPLAP